MRFEVTHHLPGHNAPTTTLTDTDGVNALLAQAETTGGALHIRRHTPDPQPEPATAGQAPEGDPRP
ncbi:hypothetical protein EDD99_5538 [Streptomyces sp. 846.5]|nr:hypothetical protein [Streptomyces sp. 846.5]TDT97408.1 hypothetical protein EDD99_5538 [Streptomyces sp. 846.5]